MRTISLLPAVIALAVAGCGGDGESGSKAASDDAAMKKKEDAAMQKKDEDAMEKGRATITLRESGFGPMLFDESKQAIYVFERDSRNGTVCYEKCAEEWPPALSKGAPHAENGVDDSLLGTIKRRDGRTQVTYAGKPLYFYAHEDPGVVLCHNVNKNGGYWWVIGADGKRRPA